MNNPPPKTDPTTSFIPSSDAPAVKEDMTSGAPLAKATRVTPANVSDILSLVEIFERAGER